MKMNEASCDIHDVARSAKNLVSLSCTLGATHFDDGTKQLQFNTFVASYVDGVIRAVEDGAISAWEGMQEIQQEYADLYEKASFYAQNAVGVLGGAVQVEAGTAMISTVVGAPIGGILIAHGTNNIYEGLGNIYNGYSAPSVVGPTRELYRKIVDNPSDGDIAYYSADIVLSILGMAKQVRTAGSVELFIKDPINYRRAYQQAGKTALAFEVLVDYYSVKTIMQIEPPEKPQ
ncbi:DUF4225 domain-containing protein [Pseudomonas sp. DG56-2]|uniref:DUF4225 domain-containing protein n=1 Tax=Pseudomonas sp. DG56-2 TaxID=2320270 RepID=UPI001C49B0B6|nr:DUF4225 domain-containing protein [Pseudomonas sp. DG56-2]